jgi:tellurite resistance protein TerC
MIAFGSWADLGHAPEFWVLVGFHMVVVLLLALDLGVFQRQAHAVSLKEAALWSAVWIALALLFAGAIWIFWDLWRPEEPHLGTTRAIEYLTGYLVEKALSVDNLFVFLVIFRYFAVPAHLQPRVLLWGVLGAVVLRATLILAGAALLAAYHWMIYLFGGFLLYTGCKLWLSGEREIDPGQNRLLRLARQFLPVVEGYETPHLLVRRAGRWYATPLLLVLLVVESMDVVFAIDSIPAVFAITQDAFIVYTSNIFAILGLRALYFLLAGLLGRLRYLKAGLALVLAFVGLKMLLEDSLAPWLAEWGIKRTELILISLGVITVILSLAAGASLLTRPKFEVDVSAEVVSNKPGEELKTR